MKGYIAIVCRRGNRRYEAEFPNLPVRNYTERSVDEALHRARCALDEFARRSERALPAPRPSSEMLAEAVHRGAVAAMCILPRPGS